jgi:hypothetical protein
MRSLIISIASLLICINSVNAQHKSGGHQHSVPMPRPATSQWQHQPGHYSHHTPPYWQPQHRNFQQNYYLRHGHNFQYGYYYLGHNHMHWSRVIWDQRYGCYLYYDPWLLKWYYWCAPHNCYYPVEYAPVGYMF